VDCVEREIQLFEDTAIVTTVIYLKASSGGRLIEGKTRFLRIWKKFNNGWKIIGVASVNLG
jgi:ketosteroid isomerase-like protein